MFLQKSLQRSFGPTMQMQAARVALGAKQVQSSRPFFSVMDKMKDRFRIPLRHIQSFAEVDGMNQQSQMPEGYRTHGNTAASFSASLTQNALELNQWHEMESTVHSQFGTVDNPVLIFTSDSSWRIVICMGPGIEDDSHSHEKIFYMVREGPINRCQVCGQCFKIVRLKDEFSEEQDYYTMMFSTLSHFDVSEEDMGASLLNLFGDRPHPNYQTIPATNVYIHVNSDVADRILVDPAYKLEKLKEAHGALYAMGQAYREVDKAVSSQMVQLPTTYGRAEYETWANIELAIGKFDRIFNKVEKFNARKLADPDNYERRQKRMLERKQKRVTENFTYFYQGLTEEEQQYRDYFETDLEADPEDEYLEEMVDRARIANTGDLNPALYDFVESQLPHEVTENFEDIIEDKIFKYKYRQYADSEEVFKKRMYRVKNRFVERARTRDPAISQNIAELYLADEKFNSTAAFMVDRDNYDQVATKGTRAWREYMAMEGVQQYRDYYEDDPEEQGFFEYLDELPNRDRVRFMELFEDWTMDRRDRKAYVMIPKREFNPELSAFSNLILDLVDFKDRVRPLANDIARLDVGHQYQKHSIEEIERARGEFERGLAEKSSMAADGTGNELTTPEEGYSSLELPAESELSEFEDAASAKPVFEEAKPEEEEEQTRQTQHEDAQESEPEAAEPETNKEEDKKE